MVGALRATVQEAGRCLIGVPRGEMRREMVGEDIADGAREAWRNGSLRTFWVGPCVSGISFRSGRSLTRLLRIVIREMLDQYRVRLARL